MTDETTTNAPPPWVLSPRPPVGPDDGWPVEGKPKATPHKGHFQYDYAEAMEGLDRLKEFAQQGTATVDAEQVAKLARAVRTTLIFCNTLSATLNACAVPCVLTLNTDLMEVGWKREAP